MTKNGTPASLDASEMTARGVIEHKGDAVLSSSTMDREEDDTGSTIVDVQAVLQSRGGTVQFGMEGTIVDEHEDSDEHNDNVINDFADNPMMDRVQTALRNQLEKARDRVKRELREQEEALRLAKKQREDTGVTLYGMQQQLARLQKSLQSANDRHLSVIEAREKDEVVIVDFKKSLEKKRDATNEIRKDADKTLAELNTLNETVRQMKRYNEEMKGEIAVTRRAAYKAEESAQYLEKGKKEQDIYIDSLQEQVRQLEEEVSLTDSQLSSQRERTAAVMAMLKEAGTELELLTFEKKQLVQQWKSSLVALKMRDEALAAATRALRDMQNETTNNETELERLRRDVVSNQATKEELISRRDRLWNETKVIEESIKKIQAQRVSAAERHELLQKSIAATTEEEGKVSAKLARLQSERFTTDLKIEHAVKDRQKLEERIASNKYDQTTLSVAVKNLLKEEKSILAQIHRKELESATLQNSLARTKIDRLNTEAHNFHLRGTLKENVEQLKETEGLIEQREVEIQKRNDEIEKKMAMVDTLNRKYSKMLDDVDEEPLGPLEATIKILKKENEVQEEDTLRLQREWLSDQTQLIQTIGETEAVQEKNAELNARLNIMAQKRVRITQNIHSAESELKGVQSSIQGMHSDMSRLNDLIGENTKLHGELSSSRAILEKEGKTEIKQMETDCLKTEQRIAAVKAEKKALLDDMLEVERQVLVWEKKIQLEKETQEALKTSEGMNDVKGMKKEITRMQHRLEKMKRNQEFMVREMERAIEKREDIAIKYTKSDKKKARGKNDPVGITNADLQKQAASLKKQIKGIRREQSEYIERAKKLGPHVQRIQTDLELAQRECSERERELEKMRRSTEEKIFDRERLLAQMNRHQSIVDKYEALQKGTVSPARGKVDLVDAERRLAVEVDKLRKVKNAVGALRVKFPDLDDVLGKAGCLVDDILCEER